MGVLRNRAFLGAVAICAILALYFTMVVGRAIVFVETGDPIAIALGVALFVLPAVGVWWMVNEWRLGTTVQRMANQLEANGRLPVQDGERDEFGRFTEDAKHDIYETARRGVEMAPEDWVAWFHVAYAYDAAHDRSMARKSLRYAASLFRAEQRASARR
jgi:hypothetical protein